MTASSKKVRKKAQVVELESEDEEIIPEIDGRVLNLTRSELDWVCQHLGHTLDVHQAPYRATSDVLGRVNIAKPFLMQDNGLIQSCVGTRLQDVKFSGTHTISNYATAS